MIRRIGYTLGALVLSCSAVAFAAPSADTFTAASQTPANFVNLPAGMSGGAEVGNALIFDSMTAPGPVGSATVTHTFMSGAMDCTLGGGASPAITGIDIVLVNNTGAALTTSKMVLNVRIWGVHNNLGTATPVYSNNLGTFQFDFGAQAALPNASFFNIQNSVTPGVDPGLTFGVPVVVPSNQNWGMTFNWQAADANGVLQNLSGLTTGIRGGASSPAFTVGAPDFAGPNFGYYRNASGEVDFNFLGTSSRQVGANSAAVYRVYATAVPEPASLGLLALGGITLIARRRKA